MSAAFTPAVLRTSMRLAASQARPAACPACGSRNASTTGRMFLSPVYRSVDVARRASSTLCSAGTPEQSAEPTAPAAQPSNHRPDINVVLVEPQIPQNSGNAARTCAAMRVPMHLVGPLGFKLDSTKLKRAGLDYWPYVCVKVHDGWAEFLEFFDALPQPKRLVAFSKFSQHHYAVDGTYRPGEWLLFGAETHGLPEGADEDILSRGGLIVKIPMDETHVRSLNLATSVGIGLYEAARQLDAPQAGAVVTKQVDH